MSEYKLTSEIMCLSVGATWDEAKLEWELDEIFRSEDASTCLCGHFPIVELCRIRNKENGKEAIVGNCCVKKFIGLSSSKVFQALKRVQKDRLRALNGETIDYAFRKGWLNSWKRRFYFDTMRKRNLSGKQSQKRLEINQKILQHVAMSSSML